MQPHPAAVGVDGVSTALLGSGGQICANKCANHCRDRPQKGSSSCYLPILPLPTYQEMLFVR